MSRRLKVLHVVFSLDPGGMENGIVNVAAGLDPARFEVHVCCLNNAGPFVERLPEPQNVYVLGRKSGLDFAAVRGLYRVISKVKPDVVHSHNLGPLTYSTLATLFGLRRPILHGEHGVLPLDQCTPKRVRHRKLLYKCCRKVHTVSTGQKAQLGELGLPADQIAAIINGVDTVRFSPAPKGDAKKALGIAAENSQVIGIVGRFVGLKRHLDLLEAFDRISLKRSNVHLLVVGAGGPETDRIHQKVKASPNAPRIHLTGFQADPRPFYHAMDLLAVPSLIEGMSNVVLEAMACGIPVLAHDACGNAEMLVKDCDGEILDLSTVEKLQAGIERMLSNPERMVQMGQHARNSAVARFSIRTMIESYETIYEQVAGRTVK